MYVYILKYINISCSLSICNANGREIVNVHLMQIFFMSLETKSSHGASSQNAPEIHNEPLVFTLNMILGPSQPTDSYTFTNIIIK